jgi:hypothetical protein
MGVRARPMPLGVTPLTPERPRGTNPTLQSCSESRLLTVCSLFAPEAGTGSSAASIGNMRSYWEYEERDTTGRLIGRYESFNETSTAGLRQTGWRKFDREGNLVQVRSACRRMVLLQT